MSIQTTNIQQHLSFTINPLSNNNNTWGLTVRISYISSSLFLKNMFKIPSDRLPNRTTRIVIWIIIIRRDLFNVSRHQRFQSNDNNFNINSNNSHQIVLKAHYLIIFLFECLLCIYVINESSIVLQYVETVCCYFKGKHLMSCCYLIFKWNIDGDVTRTDLKSLSVTSALWWY